MTKRGMHYGAAMIVTLLVGAAGGSAAAADPVWLEIVPEGRVLARTVVSAGCPTISVDGKTSTMSARLATGSNTPPPGQRLTCQTDVTGAGKVAVAGIKLRMPPKNPKRIVVLGDTGCRIKVSGKVDAAADPDHDDGDAAAGKAKVQDCNTDWPFQTVADSAAASKPDLVVHVGDYLYRESPCPSGDNKECGGSPSGDNWPTWHADFFKPAKNLLAAAPWVFVRGNHEICKRAGKGWSYYLAPDAYASNDQCADLAPAYAVKIGDFHAWIYDSSLADDSPAKDVGTYKAIYQQAAAAGLSHAWLISHRPLWALKAGPKGDRENFQTLNATLQAAWAAAPIAGIDLSIAGHTHMFELMSFSTSQPPQLVIGNGGTMLARKLKAVPAGQQVGTATLANIETADDFGYGLFEADAKGGGWSLQLHNSKGKKKLVCNISDGKTSCSKAP